MRVTRLETSNLRCFTSLSLLPGPGINVLVGDNGAGKTSVLEALHLMAYGRSFRGRVRDGLVRSGADALEVFVEWQPRDDEPRMRKAGLRHGGQRWEGRLDGMPVDQLSQLCAALEVVSFEPGSHALVEGGGEPRRRFLDWGLFHVEPGFFPVWRRYHRALKQRNALLKAGGSDIQLDSWDHELAEAGESLGRYREEYLERVQPQLQPMLSQLAPSLGEGVLHYHPGWRRAEVPLADALLLARGRDRAVGYTSVGPHRADWKAELTCAPNQEPLSRGQAKLLAMTCLLAQAQTHALAAAGSWPIVVLDDLASELDQKHQHRVLDMLRVCGVQVFISGTVLPAGIDARAQDTTVFHVEHGALNRMC